MTLFATPTLGRRGVLLGASALAGGLLLPALATAQAARLATPAQSAGPFYPSELPADADHDLVVLRGAPARAEGTVLHLRGRVVDVNGAPLVGARVEIWQCDARGRYLHPASGGAGPRDPGFQGFGRVTAGADGAYGFRTIRPVRYPGRTPHIHALIETGRTRLVTQLYVAGEPLNQGDGLYRSLNAREQEAVTIRLEAAEGIEPGALVGQIDLVLRA